MKKKYAIYGDDDQVRLNEIFEEEEEIQYLVDLSNQKTMSERKKQASKKKVLDTTVNNEKPGDVDDIEQGNPVDKKKQDKKKKKEDKDKPSKKSKKTLIAIIIVLFAIVIVSTVGTLYGDKINEVINQENTNNEVVIENSSNQATLSFNDVVRVSQTMNEELQNYYAEIQQIVIDSKDGDVSEAINNFKNKVNEDYSHFLNYESHYKKYDGGINYYNSLKSRFENIKNLADSIAVTDDNEKMKGFISKAITDENKLIINSKNELINFFEANNVKYQEEDEKIKYKTE